MHNWQIPSYVFSRSYFEGTEKSRTVITNTLWITHHILEGVSSDVWSILPKSFTLDSLRPRWTEIDIDIDDKDHRVEIENFLHALRQDGLIQIIGEENPRPSPIIQDEREYLDRSHIPYVAAKFNKGLVAEGLLPCALIELTYRCNERCVHCFNPKSSYNPTNELTTGEIIAVINDLYEVGINNIFFSGGEASLRTDLFDILDEVRRLDMPFTMFSNGQISDTDVRKLIAYYPQMFAVSIYSATPEIHDATTGRKGSFANSIRTMEMFVEAGILTTLKCPLMNHNVHGYKEIFHLADQLGAVPQFDVQIRPTFDGDQGVCQHQIVDMEILYQLCRDPRLLIYVDSKLPHQGRFLRAMDDEYLCASGMNVLSVGPDGTVYPCNCMPIELGNVRNSNIRDIWRYSELLAAWKSVTLNDFNECGLYSECSYCRICPAMSVLETNDWFGTPESLCMTARVRRDIAEKLAAGFDVSPDDRFGTDVSFRKPIEITRGCPNKHHNSSGFLSRFHEIRREGNPIRKEITPEAGSPVALEITKEQYRSDSVFFPVGRR
jgi:radical SAM protein with 4Fe4S-binding SPASM domain